MASRASQCQQRQQVRKSEKELVPQSPPRRLKEKLECACGTEEQCGQRNTHRVPLAKRGDRNGDEPPSRRHALHEGAGSRQHERRPFTPAERSSDEQRGATYRRYVIAGRANRALPRKGMLEIPGNATGAASGSCLPSWSCSGSRFVGEACATFLGVASFNVNRAGGASSSRSPR